MRGSWNTHILPHPPKQLTQENKMYHYFNAHLTSLTFIRFFSFSQAQDLKSGNTIQQIRFNHASHNTGLSFTKLLFFFKNRKRKKEFSTEEYTIIHFEHLFQPIKKCMQEKTYSVITQRRFPWRTVKLSVGSTWGVTITKHKVYDPLTPPTPKVTFTQISVFVAKI